MLLCVRVCVCVLPRIQPNANLLQLSITDGKTIARHLKEKKKERRKESRQESEIDIFLLNRFREPTTPFIVCSEHFFYISLATAKTPLARKHET